MTPNHAFEPTCLRQAAQRERYSASMTAFRLVPFLALFPLCALAQAPVGPPCSYSIERPMAFRSTTSAEKLKISIGPGACHSAELAITILTSDNKVLYSYKAPFKRHTAVAWDDADLPKVAKEFVQEVADRGLVARSELPNPRSREKITDEYPFELVIPKVTYDRLLRTNQPVFYHATYYEGGRFIAFDPVSKQTKVIIQWGL